MRRSTSFRVWIPVILTALLAPLPSQAQEIDRVALDGGSMEIIILDTFFQPLKVTLDDRDGNPVDSVWLDPSLDEQTVNLDPALASLPSRGWQHRLVLTDEEGVLVDETWVRLGLECEADGTLCDVVARTGLRIDGGVVLTPEVAALFEGAEASGAALDLADEVALDPSLLGPIVETSVDMTSSLPVGTCECFFAAEQPASGRETHSGVISHHEIKDGQPEFTFDHYQQQSYPNATTFRASHANVVRTKVSFHCSQVGGAEAALVATSSGDLAVSFPVLLPCEQACQPEIEWDLGWHWWEIVLAPEGGASSEASFELTWSLDAAQAFNSQETRYQVGTLIQPAIYPGDAPSPIQAVVRTPPSTAVLSSTSYAEVKNWNPSDLPQATVEAGVGQMATGTSGCSEDLSLEIWPNLFEDVQSKMPPPDKIRIILEPVDG